MGTEDGGAQPGGDGGGREAALEALLGGEVEALAHEILAGQRLQHREAERDDVRSVPQDLERVGRRLAEVERRVDQDPLPGHSRIVRGGGSLAQGPDHVPDDVEPVGAIADVDRVRPRRQTAGVRDDDAGTDLGGDVDELGIVPGPGVVDEVQPDRRGCPGHLGSPGVEAEDEPGVGASSVLEEG